MRFFRFHLSTLLLSSILLGALIGLRIQGGIWQFKEAILLDTKSDVKNRHVAILREWCDAAHFDPPERLQCFCITRYDDDLARIVETDAAMNVSLRSKVHGREINIVKLKDGEGTFWIGISQARQFLAVFETDHVDIFRRTRGYGWKGYTELPLFWVAALAAVGLVATFVRSLAGAVKKFRRRDDAKQNQPVKTGA